MYSTQSPRPLLAPAVGRGLRQLALAGAVAAIVGPPSGARAEEPSNEARVEEASPRACGGTARLHAGQMEMAVPLRIADFAAGSERLDEATRCATLLGRLLAEHPLAASVMISTHVGGSRATSDAALEALRTVASLLTSSGFAANRIAAVVRSTAPDTDEGIVELSWRERSEFKPAGQVFAISGPVWIISANGARGDLNNGAVLMTGQTLETGATSVVRFVLGDGTHVRMAGVAALHFVDTAFKPIPRVRLELLKGSASFTRANRDGDLQVATGNSRVAAQGMAFRVSVTAEGVTFADSLEGTTLVSGSAGDVFVSEGKSTRIDFRGVPTTPTAILIRPAPIEPLYGPMRAGELLVWDPVPEAKTYRVELARDAAFTDHWFPYELTGTTLPLADTYHGGRWYWRVIAGDAEGAYGMPSQVFAFETR